MEQAAVDGRAAGGRIALGAYAVGAMLFLIALWAIDADAERKRSGFAFAAPTGGVERDRLTAAHRGNRGDDWRIDAAARSPPSPLRPRLHFRRSGLLRSNPTSRAVRCEDGVRAGGPIHRDKCFAWDVDSKRLSAVHPSDIRRSALDANPTGSMSWRRERATRNRSKCV